MIFEIKFVCSPFLFETKVRFSRKKANPNPPETHNFVIFSYHPCKAKTDLIIISALIMMFNRRLASFLFFTYCSDLIFRVIICVISNCCHIFPEPYR